MSARCATIDCCYPAPETRGLRLPPCVCDAPCIRCRPAVSWLLVFDCISV